MPKDLLLWMVLFFYISAMTELMELKPLDILEWLQEICDTPGWSAKRIAEEAKLPYKAGAQEIYNTLGRTHRIHVDLVNWILAQRFKGDMARAAEIVKGLDAKQYEKLREYADLLRNQPVRISGAAETIPTGATMEPPAERASEPAAPYGREPRARSQEPRAKSQELPSPAKWSTLPAEDRKLVEGYIDALLAKPAKGGKPPKRRRAV